MFDIWRKHPCDMTLMMRHVVDALMLIWRSRAHVRSMSSFEDEIPNASYHDYFLSRA